MEKSYNSNLDPSVYDFGRGRVKFIVGEAKEEVDSIN